MAIEETQRFEVPATEPGPAPVSYERAERRTFGLAPHSLVATLGALALGAAIVLLSAGRLVMGLLLLAAALFFGALYLEQARRRRNSAVDRLAAAAVDNSRAFAGFAGASLRAWTTAGRRSAQLKLEVSRLARERSQLQYSLGGAAFAADEDLTESLRDRMRDLDRRIEECAELARAVIERARSRTSQDRLAVGSTEIQRPDDAST